MSDQPTLLLSLFLGCWTEPDYPERHTRAERADSMWKDQQKRAHLPAVEARAVFPLMLFLLCLPKLRLI